jgi:hypothetical protein
MIQWKVILKSNNPLDRSRRKRDKEIGLHPHWETQDQQRRRDGTHLKSWKRDLRHPHAALTSQKSERNTAVMTSRLKTRRKPNGGMTLLGPAEELIFNQGETKTEPTHHSHQQQSLRKLKIRGGGQARSTQGGRGFRVTRSPSRARTQSKITATHLSERFCIVRKSRIKVIP